MKYIFALVVTLCLLVPPNIAHAWVVNMNVVPSQQYLEGGSFEFDLDGWAAIYDSTSYDAIAMTGNFGTTTSSPWGGFGLYISNGFTEPYLWVGGSTGTISCPYSNSAFGGRGCLLPLSGFDLNHEQDLHFWMTYYPSLGYWAFWVRDRDDLNYEIGTYTAPSAWFTGISYNTSMVYYSNPNPWWTTDAQWSHPRGYLVGPLPNYRDFTSATVATTNSNPADNNFCPGRGGVWINPDIHAWFAGTNIGDYTHPLCGGQTLWYDPNASLFALINILRGTVTHPVQPVDTKVPPPL